ncbi:MAG: hypothetical protein GC191_11535 [Azospirillum sp.]|nr:hypothetical protein [Azospirillum sp.]
MSRLRLFGLRLIVVLVAAGLPLAGLVAVKGGPPATLDVASLDAWSPLRSAGPSTRLLARGLTNLAGVGADVEPQWFTADDRRFLDDAETAIRNNKLKEALGQLMVLSSRLEDRGKTLDDFLPLVMPDLATWMIANYFAPVLLGSLLVMLALLIFGPWLIRRFYDFLKLLMTLVLGIGAVAVAATLCFALAGQKALVFVLIEYLAAVAVLLTLGNLMLYAAQRRRARSEARAAGSGSAELPGRPASAVGTAAALPPLSGPRPAALEDGRRGIRGPPVLASAASETPKR